MASNDGKYTFKIVIIPFIVTRVFLTMGRTQTTYRMRLQQIRDRLTPLSRHNPRRYHQLWQTCHQLSAPSSTLPYPDTHAIASFAMILDAFARLVEIENKINASVAG